jgi:hypothetical protein
MREGAWRVHSLIRGRSSQTRVDIVGGDDTGGGKDSFSSQKLLNRLLFSKSDSEFCSPNLV